MCMEYILSTGDGRSGFKTWSRSSLYTDGVRGCLVVHRREGACEYSPVLTQA